MRSLRSDTLTMRVTGVRITVFSSAIVIDVIVHCHTAGALYESNGRKHLSLSSCGWVLIRSGQFMITCLLGFQQRVRLALEISRESHLIPASTASSLHAIGSAWKRTPSPPAPTVLDDVVGHFFDQLSRALDAS